MLENAVGVIGGVGPMATVCFCELVLSMTYAERDQDHVNMIVLNHAAIPDRTAFICGASDDSPLPYMIADAKSLEKAGARFIVIPCNTAHYFFDEIAASVSVPVLNIVRETVLEAKRRIKGLEKLGVLATDGTLLTKSYDLAANEQNIECVTPDEDVQRQVMSLVYDDVKAGKRPDKEKLRGFIDHLRQKGCRCVVLGCTELSVAKKECGMCDDDVLDSLEVLALRTIERCGRKIRSEYLIS